MKGKYQIDTRGVVIKRKNFSHTVMSMLEASGGFCTLGNIKFFDLERFNPKEWDSNTNAIHFYRFVKKEALNEYIKAI